LTLDARERVLDRERPVLYSRDGISAVVQPGSRRCVVLCTRVVSTETDHVLARMSEYLDLEHPFTDVKERDNLRPDEALYTADYVNPDKVLKRPRSHIYFAGSYLRNSYPVDSGEGATRTALAAVRRMERRYDLVPVPR
jgi:hypothetical protein